MSLKELLLSHLLEEVKKKGLFFLIFCLSAFKVSHPIPSHPNSKKKPSTALLRDGLGR